MSQEEVRSSNREFILLQENNSEIQKRDSMTEDPNHSPKLKEVDYDWSNDAKTLMKNFANMNAFLQIFLGHVEIIYNN